MLVSKHRHMHIAWFELLMADEHNVVCFHHGMQNNSFTTALLLTLTVVNFLQRCSIFVGIITEREQERTKLLDEISLLQTELTSVQANSKSQTSKLDTV